MRRSACGSPSNAVSTTSPLAARRFGDLLQQAGEVDDLRRLAGVSLRKGEIVLKHARHLVDVGAERLGVRTFAEQCQLELEAGEHGAKVVADAGEHGGALLDLPLDPPLHLYEGQRGLAHLARAARPEGIDRPALAELLGGIGELQDRLDLVAQEEERDCDQHKRGAGHPEKEDLRVGGVGAASRREHPQHMVAEVDANFDHVGIAERVEPERPVDVAADLARKRRVEQREERPRAGLRQRIWRQHRDRQPIGLGGDARDVGEALVLRIGLDDLDDGGDVAHQRAGQAPRHQLPMPLHEDVGDDRLQDQDRHHDDQDRAGVKALRQAIREHSAEMRQAEPLQRERSARAPTAILAARRCAPQPIRQARRAADIADQGTFRCEVRPANSEA